MKFKKIAFDGVYLITLEPKFDKRGWFERVFCEQEFKKNNIDFKIVQVNRSFNRQKGIIRGLHYQKNPKAEGKIIQVTKGKIYDVAVDIRKGSLTFGQWLAVELNAVKNKLLYLQPGFAHGYQTLTAQSELVYYMSEFYSPVYACGIRWNDPQLKIRWPLAKATVSDKDRNLPFLNSI